MSLKRSRVTNERKQWRNYTLELEKGFEIESAVTKRLKSGINRRHHLGHNLFGF